MPLGLGDLSCQYAKDIKTPNLESLKLFVRNLITKTGHFPAFLYQTAIHVLLPMIKYSFFKNHRFLRRLLIPSEGSFNFYPSIALLSYPPKTGGY
jgi:hypothetical protein